MNTDEAEKIRSKWLEELRAHYRTAELTRKRVKSPALKKYWDRRIALFKARVAYLEYSYEH